MGNRSKETIPPAKRISARPRTRSRLFSAKSTMRRIIYLACLSRCSKLLLHRVLQWQGVRDHAIAGLQAGNDLLHVAGKHAARLHFETLEVERSDRRINPLAIVQVQDRGCGNGGARLRLLAI